MGEECLGWLLLHGGQGHGLLLHCDPPSPSYSSTGVNFLDRRGCQQMLDLVTPMVTRNSVNVSSIESIHQRDPWAWACRDLSLAQSGMLNMSFMMEMDKVVGGGITNTSSTISSPRSLVLPFRLELWCVIISSKELEHRSHMISMIQS